MCYVFGAAIILAGIALGLTGIIDPSYLLVTLSYIGIGFGVLLLLFFVFLIAGVCFQEDCCKSAEQIEEEKEAWKLRDQESKEVQQMPLLPYIGRRLEEDTPELYTQIANKMLANEADYSAVENRLLRGAMNGKDYMVAKQLEKDNPQKFEELKPLAEEDVRKEEQREREKEAKEKRDEAARECRETWQRFGDSMNKTSDGFKQNEFQMITGSSTTNRGAQLDFDLARARRNNY